MRTLAFFAAVAGVAVLASAMVAPTTIAAERTVERTVQKKPRVKVAPAKPAPGAVRIPAATPKMRAVVPVTPPGGGDCPPTQVRINGQCQCPQGTAKNGERCVSSTAAPPCPPTQAPIDGRCQCPPGTAKNGERCVSSTAAPPCPPTQALINGRCQCRAGTAWTGQSCVAPLDITTTNPLPLGVTWQLYSKTLTAAGGTPPYTWSLVGTPAGYPPGWLTLSPSGVLSGTPGSFFNTPVTATVTDATPGTPLTATKTFALTVALLQITTDPTLPRAIQGQAYSRTLGATGGTPPYMWSLAGTPPTWLTLSPTGVLSGTPTGPNQSGILVKVTDITPGTPLTATKTFSLPVTLPGVQSLDIPTTSPLPQAIEWHSYSQTLTATGGTPPYTWSFFETPNSNPPAWLTLSPTGVLSGTPTEPSQFSIIVKVTDNNPGISLTAMKTFALTAAAGAPLHITTGPELPPAMQGQSYSQTLAATGGLPPYTWSLVLGFLPSGLTLSPAGVLSGIPTGVFQSGFVVKVTDSTPGTPLTTTKTLGMTAYSNEVPILITTPFLGHATYGEPYARNLTAVGGTAPYAWSLAGTPPAWLSLSAAGLLSANWPPVPTATGSYSLTVMVKDATPGTPLTTTKTFALTSALPLAITTTSALPPATHGQSYSQTLTATGGMAPYTWSTLPGVPWWLNLSPSGVLSGTPPVSVSGLSSFTLKVNDAIPTSEGSRTKTFLLSVQ